jgi:hypothetical protein
MTLDWSDLAAAVALLMVLEGILPFVSPGAMKNLFARLSALRDQELRLAGLGSMLAGLVILFVVR